MPPDGSQPSGGFVLEAVDNFLLELQRPRRHHHHRHLGCFSQNVYHQGHTIGRGGGLDEGGKGVKNEESVSRPQVREKQVLSTEY